ncbi:class I SAM-dependent methyltransferase [uncultured Ilyobacter sp.]|uniref:class I SAM-dependent methyltransferase n=1 Tax=uncultured Ilyobacter sp. TaxID=544433 RepID=UPI0029F47C8D|nr:class I SAM-dependent methyltransferase [uncultured Ilyobacter sp.]
MHTKTTPENPYALNRYAFAWHHIPDGSAAHLDFGCHDGQFLQDLDGKRIERRVGIDAATEPLEKGRQARPDLEFIHNQTVTPLPFEDQSFQSATVLDVIEHIVPQHELLLELHRVLREDGVLIVTVPGQHLFSCLDLGNFKFRFPRLHRWWYVRKHSVAEYEARYGVNADGLIGDISAEKSWHEHFSRRKLQALLENAGFEVREFDGRGFFRRVLVIFQKTVGRIGFVGRLLDRLLRADLKAFESTDLFCVAKKKL